MATLILLPVIVPVLCAVLMLFLPQKAQKAITWISVAASLIAFAASAMLLGKDVSFTIPWAGQGMDMSFRAYLFSELIVLSMSAFSLLISLYCVKFLTDKNYSKFFMFFFILTLGLASGAALADNLVLLLFFWEGMLCTIFGMIYVGGKDSYRTAIKAFVIIGVTDLTMMLGIALTGHIAGTFDISKIHLILSPAASAACAMMMIGAVAKAGAMPFHTWIPDSAIDAPLPFMALIPAALEKLIGIYFLARITLDIFVLSPSSWLSYALMILGCATIVFAVLMALIQTNYKRLLSYHAISQVGYMVLGIGTAVPIGIVGGLFHMINHTVYKSCLFSQRRLCRETDRNDRSRKARRHRQGHAGDGCMLHRSRDVHLRRASFQRILFERTCL